MFFFFFPFFLLLLSIGVVLLALHVWSLVVIFLFSFSLFLGIWAIYLILIPEHVFFSFLFCVSGMYIACHGRTMDRITSLSEIYRSTSYFHTSMTGFNK